jgi:NAD(P)-dependent dehydrogenase (short-subunit alcohol dehydrogenase family)
MTIYPGRFNNRTAIVTGGASGLGLEAAKRITAEGGKVCRQEGDRRVSRHRAGRQ